MLGVASSSSVLLLLCFFRTIICAENNVCPTFNDYYTIQNNSKCWYDLSAENDVPNIIRLNGYSVIEYQVPTPDGFTLTLFRIPNNKVNNNTTAKSNPVYLQHGLFATSALFLGLGKNSLAFVLADAGYDVWLGNYRGTEYSEKHVNLTVHDQEYWNFSLNEMVQYDLPAIFQLILSHTANDGKNNQIIYIGHSLGTTLALMYGAEFPSEAKNIIKTFVLLAPGYTLKNIISPYKYLAPYGTIILNTINDFELTRLVSQADPARQINRQLCLESPRLMRLCLQMNNLLYGINTQMGAEIAPVFYNQLPGGCSVKVLHHASDLALGNFRKYNYVNENFKHYGSASPPTYDISKINVPVYIVYSTQDWVTTEKDAWNLYYHLNESVRMGIRKIDLKYFNHLDFVFGRQARRVLYEDLVILLDNIISK